MKKVLISALFLSTLMFGQGKVDYFPDSLNISPFTAKVIEPKIGFSFQTGANELELNIGNSLDIVHLKKGETGTLSIGADFFTFTLLRGEANFHFLVDAVDYLFGLNFGYKTILNDNEIGVRVRLSHISAHFVDGHYEGVNKRWKDNLNPRVYSREFVEVLPFYKTGSLRAYAGFTYIFSVDPESIGKDNYHLGLEYFQPKAMFNLFRFFIAYDLKVIHLDKYTANNSVQVGVRFGKTYGKGFGIYYQYYSGKSHHGEYYDFTKRYSAIGFNLEL